MYIQVLASGGHLDLPAGWVGGAPSHIQPVQCRDQDWDWYWDHHHALAYSLRRPWPAVWGGLALLLLAKITPNLMCGGPETGVVLLHVTVGV